MKRDQLYEGDKLGKLCVHTKSHTHTQSRTDTHTHTHTQSWTNTHSHAQTHTHTVMHAHTHTHTTWLFSLWSMCTSTEIAKQGDVCIVLKCWCVRFVKALSLSDFEYNHLLLVYEQCKTGEGWTLGWDMSGTPTQNSNKFRSTLRGTPRIFN
jgi:hypothetical protein